MYTTENFVYEKKTIIIQIKIFKNRFEKPLKQTTFGCSNL